MRQARFFSLAAIALLAEIPGPVRAATISHLSLETSSGDKLIGTSSKTYELSIDDSAEVRVDAKGLLSELHLSSAALNATASLSPRIQILSKAVDALIHAQEGLLAAKSSALALEAAKGTAGESAARAAFEVANSSFSDIAVSALSPLSESLDSDAELKASLEPALNEAVLQGDYASMAEVLKRYLLDVGSNLDRKAENAQRVEVTLQATISDGVLHQQRVHLDGFDDIRTGEPVPFPRFQIALDDRAREEFAASEKLADNVNRILDGSFQIEVKASLKRVETSLHELVRTAKTDVLEAELNDTLKTLIVAQDGNLSPIIEEIVSVRDILSGLDKLPAPSDASKLETLLQISGAISTKAGQLEAVASNAPGKLGKLSSTIQRLAKEKPGLISSRLQQMVLATKAGIAKELEPLQASYKTLRDLAKAIGLTTEVVEAADNMASKSKELGVGSSLDSRFDLQTIKGWQRHPGDQLSITLRVDPKGADSSKGSSLAFGRQTLRLEKHGPYLQARGALLFVDSRSSKVPKQSFEAAPGVAFHLKYGFKNQSWWNEWLAPGAGVSLAMLNFDNNKNFELGIAGSLTLIRDLFWVGYGRNLQAQADYFFVGINPIALGSLYQQKTR